MSVRALPRPEEGLRRWATRRRDIRLWAGLLLMLLAVAGGLALWKAADTRVPVVVATHDLAPGTLIQPADLQVAREGLDPQLRSLVVPAESLNGVTGRALSERVPAGGLILWSAIRPGPAVPNGSVALGLLLTPEAASGQKLGANDLVDVFATYDKGQASQRTLRILTAVQILSAQEAPPQTSARGTVLLSLALTPAQATQLAGAKASAVIDVALVAPGTRPASTSSSPGQ